MDTKAEDNQKEWKPQFGDLTNIGVVTKIFINGDIGIVTPGGYCVSSKDLLTWIPK